VRSEPAHQAEQTTQLLFGEKAEVLELTKNDWARIRCAWDEYEGWCKLAQLAVVPHKIYRKETRHITANHTCKLVLPNGALCLPLGSELAGLKGRKLMLNNEEGIFKGKKLARKTLTLSCEHLRDAAMRYVYAPYEWGGRSLAGLDCSGLTQMIFKLCNFPIPRDASQQALQGTLVDFLQHAQCGDLAFFDNTDGKITHVGLLLDNQTIVHATETTGRVVIDRIDQEGIISTMLKKRTHHLRLVKRFL